MEDIKNIIAKNLVELRKKHNLTQNELAEKINYSDNAVSRWEHAEVTPSIETLQQIANIYNVPLTSLIEDDVIKTSEIKDRKQLVSKLAMVLISASLVWVFATLIFVTAQLVWEKTFWQIFVWALPINSLVMFPFYKYWGGHIYKFVIQSIFLWTLLGSIFLQYYQVIRWFWMIFIVGIPIQTVLAIVAFIKPNPNKKTKEQKLKAKIEKHELKAQKKAERHKLKAELKNQKLAKKEKK